MFKRIISSSFGWSLTELGLVALTLSGLFNQYDFTAHFFEHSLVILIGERIGSIFKTEFSSVLFPSVHVSKVMSSYSKSDGRIVSQTVRDFAFL